MRLKALHYRVSLSSFVVDGEEKDKVAYGVNDGRPSHMSSGAVWRYPAVVVSSTE
jgi:hypothetical protein